MRPDRPRVLLDACMPHDLRLALANLDVVTARYAGLQDLDDAALLDAMTNRFDVLITADVALPRENVIPGRPIAVIVVRTPSNTMADLLPLVPAIESAALAVVPGAIWTIRTQGSSK